MLTPSPTSVHYGPDVHILSISDRTIFLIGTTHISQESVELVRLVIEQEGPDCVCLELDDKRYQTLIQKEGGQSLDLKEIFRKKQPSTFLINLLMASYQKKLGGKLGVRPGAELLAAAAIAQMKQIPISLCDRDAGITIRRAWRSASLREKCHIFTALIASLFDNTEISEEKLAELKRKDVLTELMKELGKTLPNLKRVLIDERDIFLAEKIKTSPGKRIVAIVGAGHIEGIINVYYQDNTDLMAEIATIPANPKNWKMVGSVILLIIFGALIVIGLQKDASVVGRNFLFPVLSHGIPTDCGAISALAHPYTTRGPCTAALFTSLNPLIAAGYVTAFCQVMKQPAVVREFATARTDTANG